MSNEILYVNTIADVLDISESDSVALCNKLNLFLLEYTSMYSWVTFNYINELLELFFTFKSGIKGDVIPILFSLLFKYTATKDLSNYELFIKFSDLDMFRFTKTQKQLVYYYLNTYDYSPTDLPVAEDDFNLYTDILLYKVPFCLHEDVLAIMQHKSIAFVKPKGINVDLKSLIPESLHMFIDRLSLFSTVSVKNLYSYDLKYLIKIQDKLGKK